MDATRILPDLQASLLCEEVRQEVNGNFMIIGIIGVLRVPKLPIRAFRLCLFNRWTAGVGTFTEVSRIIAPDGVTEVRRSQVQFHLRDAASHAINVTVFPNIEFKTAGIYYVEVLVDDVMKLRFPVPLIVQPPPQQTPPGQGPGGAAQGNPPSSSNPGPSSNPGTPPSSPNPPPPSSEEGPTSPDSA